MIGKETLKLITLGYGFELKGETPEQGKERTWFYEVKLYDETDKVNCVVYEKSVQLAFETLEVQVVKLIKRKLAELRRQQRELER